MSHHRVELVDAINLAAALRVDGETMLVYDADLGADPFIADSPAHSLATLVK